MKHHNQNTNEYPEQFSKVQGLPKLSTLALHSHLIFSVKSYPQHHPRSTLTLFTITGHLYGTRHNLQDITAQV